METVKLSKIVNTVTPELEQILTSEELSQFIVVKSGISSLRYEDVLEIIEASITRVKKDVLYH